MLIANSNLLSVTVITVMPIRSTFLNAIYDKS